MILIVTNKKDVTADFLIIELKRQNISFVRFNTEDFPQKVRITTNLDKQGNVVSGYINLPHSKVNLTDITSVWYRRPLRSEFADKLSDETVSHFTITESWEFLQGLWRILDCFWISNPDNIRRAESKLLQLKVAAQVGFTIPKTLVTNLPEDASSFYNLFNPIVYKTLKTSLINHNDVLSLIYTNIVSNHHAQHFNNVQFAPTLLQKYIPKLVELRITVVGGKVFPVELITQDDPKTKVDWRRSDAYQIKHREHSLPERVEIQCVELVKMLGLSFGASLGPPIKRPEK